MDGYKIHFGGRMHRTQECMLVKGKELKMTLTLGLLILITRQFFFQQKEI